MTIDLSTAVSLSLNATTGRQEVNTSRIQESFDVIEAAINNLSGSVTFDAQEAVFDTKAAAIAASGLSNRNMIALRGQTTLGDSPTALYTKQASAATSTGASFAADGSHWHLVEYEFVTEVHFGADPTGATDSADAVQNWLDFYNFKNQTTVKRNKVLTPQSGTLLLNHPIWISRGSAFVGSNPLIGNRAKGRDEANRGGTTFLKNFQGGPLLIIQGDRNFHIEGINFRHALDDVRGYLNFDERRIRDHAIWEAGRARLDGAPECFILVDGLVSNGGANLYTAGTGAGQIPISSWDGTQTLYGRLQTSGGLIQGCGFENCYHEAISIQPGDESNGDFIDVKSNNFEDVRYGVVCASSQARSMNIDNNVGQNMLEFVTTIPDGTTGSNGRINGSISYNSFSRVGRLATFHDLATGSGQTVIRGNYIESGWKWVRVSGGGSGETNLVIQDSILNQAGAVNSGGVADQPTAVVEAGATRGRIIVDGFNFNANTPNLMFFDAPMIELKRMSPRPDILANTQSEKEYMRIFMNACLGVYTPIGTLEGLFPHDVKALMFDEDTDAVSGVFGWSDPFRNYQVDRDNMIPLWQMEYHPASQYNGRRYQKYMEERRAWSLVSSISDTDDVTASLSNRVLTLNFGTLFTEQFAERIGGANGDALIHVDTKTVFAVYNTDFTARTALAYQLNNFEETSLGVFSPDETIDLTSGNLIAVNHRMFALDRAMKVDFTNGSNTASFYSPRRNAADVAAVINASSGFQVGDRLFVHGEQNGVLQNDESRVTAIVDNSDGTGTVTFAGNARYTEAGQDFVQFIRAAPANEATP